MRATNIYCPLCYWHPSAASRWVCTRKLGGCGTVWNTFDTRGICPKCAWKWEITACPACRKFSAHEAWYHEGGRETDKEKDHDTVIVEA